MIVTKAKQCLERLQRTNHKQIPDFGTDMYTETFINMIANECKSTVIVNSAGNTEIRKYESEIIKNNIDKIVRQLIINGTFIPKEVMNNIICTRNRVIGVNSDIELYKGIMEEADGTTKRTATIGKAILNDSDLNVETLNEINHEIYIPFARQFILTNQKELPKQNIFSVFKEKILHGKESRKDLSQKYIEILKKNTNYGEKIIENTVQYRLDYMFNERFKETILNSISTGNSLVPIESGRKRQKFSLLQEVISAEVQDIIGVIPDINEIHKDISQIYADIECQLNAYSTDITKLDAKQIEEAIKHINHASLIDTELRGHIGEDGYRTINVCITGNNLKLLEKEYVSMAMERLGKDIYDLVQDSSLSEEEYFKKAVALQCRFIRIHPFPDSNGRTSRALLNMITIPRGMLVDFPKEDKTDYKQSLNRTYYSLDEQNYLQAIMENSKDLMYIEESQIEDLSKFTKRNIIIPAPTSTEQEENEHDYSMETDELR